MTELSNFLNKNLVKIYRKNYQVTIICIIFFSILSLKSIYNITMLETNELLRKLTSFMEFDPLWPNFSFLQPLKTSENLWFPNLSIDSKWEFFLLIYVVLPSFPKLAKRFWVFWMLPYLGFSFSTIHEKYENRVFWI